MVVVPLCAFLSVRLRSRKKGRRARDDVTVDQVFVECSQNSLARSVGVLRQGVASREEKSRCLLSSIICLVRQFIVL